jgi:hypothetical protein
MATDRTQPGTGSPERNHRTGGKVTVHPGVEPSYFVPASELGTGMVEFLRMQGVSVKNADHEVSIFGMDYKELIKGKCIWQMIEHSPELKLKGGS